MKKFLIAAMLGGLLGVVVAPQLAGPLLAKETNQAETYKQLELFGDIFDRIRAQYVEEVDDKKLIEAESMVCSPLWIRIRATSRPMMPAICAFKPAVPSAGWGLR